MPENLLLVEDLDGKILSSLGVPRELDLGEGSLSQDPPKFVLTHTRPPSSARSWRHLPSLSAKILIWSRGNKKTLSTRTPASAQADGSESLLLASLSCLTDQRISVSLLHPRSKITTHKTDPTEDINQNCDTYRSFRRRKLEAWFGAERGRWIRHERDGPSIVVAISHRRERWEYEVDDKTRKWQLPDRWGNSTKNWLYEENGTQVD